MESQTKKYVSHSKYFVYFITWSTLIWSLFSRLAYLLLPFLMFYEMFRLKFEYHCYNSSRNCLFIVFTFVYLQVTTFTVIVLLLLSSKGMMYKFFFRLAGGIFWQLIHSRKFYKFSDTIYGIMKWLSAINNTYYFIAFLYGVFTFFFAKHDELCVRPTFYLDNID